MLYVAADPVDATNLKLLADAAGSDLKMPVEFQPPSANTVRSDLFLLEWKKDQAPFRDMAETMTAGAGPLRFNGGLATRQLTTGLQDDVLARYSDRSAALIVTSCGAGSLAVLNADLGSSNLPSSAVFVPMIGELCGRLLAANQSIAPTDCGEPLAVDLPAEVTATAGLSVVPALESSFSQEESFVVWRGEAAGAPGVYKVQRDNQTVYALATAVPRLGKRSSNAGSRNIENPPGVWPQCLFPKRRRRAPSRQSLGVDFGGVRKLCAFGVWSD